MGLPPAPGGRPMTEPTTPTPDEPSADRPASDETFTWTTDSASRPHGLGRCARRRSGRQRFERLERRLDRDRDPRFGREAVDDLAERATPTVREFSARAAEFAAVAADRAAPFARRAGEVTSDASAKLATKSRIWAADLRASLETCRHRRPRPNPAAPRALMRPTPRRRRHRLPTAAPRRRTDPARPEPRYLYSAHECPAHRPSW